MGKFIDFTNKRFGKLTALSPVEKRGKSGQRYWLCKCDCGNEIEIRGTRFGENKATNCGCDAATRRLLASTKHGESNTRLYKIWAGMKGRCYNPNNDAYKDYGGRGVGIDETSWIDDYEKFRDWSLSANYADHLTLERKDNNKGYSQDNCIWTTRKRQANNTRRNRIVEYDGKRLNVAQWAELLGMKQATLYTRLFTRKWSIDKAFTTPVRDKH